MIILLQVMNNFDEVNYFFHEQQPEQNLDLREAHIKSRHDAVAKMQDIAIEMLAQLEDLAKTAHQKPTSVLTDKVGERVLNAGCAIGRRRSAHSTIGLCRIDEKRSGRLAELLPRPTFQPQLHECQRSSSSSHGCGCLSGTVREQADLLFTTAGLSVTGPQLGRAFMLSIAGAP